MLRALVVASVLTLAAAESSQSLVPRTVFSSPYHSGCSTTGPASCTNTSVVADTCCFEANGQLLQVQFWDSDPPTGPADSWTIHGLWPDYCVSGFPQNCDPARAYTNISAILQSQGAQDTLDFMNKYWKNQGASDESFWSHEWGKHGTCMTTMDHSCLPAGSPAGAEMVAFFDTVINLYQNLTTYDWLAGAGILPDSSKTWAYDDMVAALGAHYGFKPSLDCQSGAVFQVSYYYSLIGSVIDGIWLPKDAPAKGSCPSTGIKYLPKSYSTGTTSVPTSTGSSITTTTSPTGTASPNPLPTGAHFDAVTTAGAIVGGILSLGTWSTQTLATMHIVGTVDAFTITTSKGPCQVSAGVFSCSSSVTTPSTFTAVARQDGTLLLAYNNNTWFSSDKTPSGATVYAVYADNQHAVAYQLAIDAFPTVTTSTSANPTTTTSTSTSPPVTTSITSTSSTVSTIATSTSATPTTSSTSTSTSTTAFTSSSSSTSALTTSTDSISMSSPTTSSTPSTSTTTLPSTTLASGWTIAYACATDTPSRIFKSPEYHHLTDNTPKTCTTLCGSRGYALAGVEYSDECFCAQDYVDSAAPVVAPAADCHMACAGDASQTCGAGYRVQVYASPSSSVDAGALPAGWSLTVACAVDTSSRIFENAVMVDLADNTPHRCIDHCTALGYSLAGVEYGSECFCGNAYRSGKLPEVAPTSQCQYACKGAPGLTCGGSWGIQVYSSA